MEKLVIGLPFGGIEPEREGYWKRHVHGTETLQYNVFYQGVRQSDREYKVSFARVYATGFGQNLIIGISAFFTMK